MPERVIMINTITLNPAVDNIFYLNKFEKNTNNRIREVVRSMGGKGTHVSMNLCHMGSESNAFGFAFGHNGKFIIDMLKDWNVNPLFIYADEPESRDCYLLIEDNGDSTLISEKGPLPTDEQIAAFYELLNKEVKKDDYIVLSGDSSNFPDPFIYNKIIDNLADKSPKVFLDASGASLEQCIKKSPYLIKPNREELSELVGRTLATDKDLIGAIAELDKYNIEIVAVSLGGDGSLVKFSDGMYRVHPPKVNVFNTIGCGDCFLSGILYGSEKGMGGLETLRYATAISAATAESALSVGYDIERAKELAELVDIKKI